MTGEGARHPPTARGAAAVTFVLQALVVVVAAGAIGFFAWEDLGVPTREVTESVTETLSIDPNDTVVSSCAADGSLEAMGCRMRAASLAVIGVVAITAALTLLRAPLTSISRRLLRHLPASVGPAIMALVAAVVFALTYAFLHPIPELTGDGIIRVEFFPATVGLITLIVIALGRARSTLPRRIFDARDRIPVALRAAFVVMLPLLLGRLMLEQVGGLSNMAQEQVVIATSTLVGAIAFLPSGTAEARP